MTDKLLKTKNEKKNPTFIRADAHKKKRLGSGWRKPKGLQNKMRLNLKGYRVTVKPGYGTPASLRETTNEGKKIVQVYNKNELLALKPKTEAASIGKVGRKNKEELIALAQENKITLVNLSVKKYQEKTQSLNKEREEMKKAREEKAEAEAEAEKAKKTEKTAEAKPTEKESKEESETSEAEKEAEKKEKDKILTSKKGI